MINNNDIINNVIIYESVKLTNNGTLSNKNKTAANNVSTKQTKQNKLQKLINKMNGNVDVVKGTVGNKKVIRM